MVAKERKTVSSGVTHMRALIESWLAETERKRAKAEAAGGKTAIAYLKGREDSYRDCLAILNQ